MEDSWVPIAASPFNLLWFLFWLKYMKKILPLIMQVYN